MKINIEWHSKHKMPKNPTLDQRLKWHLGHTRNCSCRPLSGKVLEEFTKKYLNIHQDFWIYFTKADHLTLASWAADCAERVLPYFKEKYPNNSLPEDALRVLKEWINSGEFSMPIIRGASLSSHAAARMANADGNMAACYAARAVGQAVATAHVPTHALGSALYALKAIAATDKDTVLKEKDWQQLHLADNLKVWVDEKLKKYQHD
jgi:hypothetical protein